MLRQPAENGRTVGRVLAQFAGLRDPALGRWVEDAVAFPSTMVDRIVPATGDADRAAVARRRSGTTVFVVGSNHVWSPVKDLDIGLETVYQGVVINKGRVIDTNKNLPIGAINNATGQIVPLGSTNSTVIFKSTKVDDQFVARVRVQRDF